MKNLGNLALVLPVVILFWGCNSTIYDIEEIEEKVEVTSTQDTSLYSQNNEIKEDLKTDTKILENKFTDKQVVAHVYAVQIGAFLDENNASAFTNVAKKEIDQSVYYKSYGGLFKVRIGSYSNLSEAIKLLDKLKNSGYSDSFIVELTYIQTKDE